MVTTRLQHVGHNGSRGQKTWPRRIEVEDILKGAAVTCICIDDDDDDDDDDACDLYSQWVAAPKSLGEKTAYNKKAKNYF